MRISKHVHSCLVFQDQGTRVLFDPGRFSFEDGRQTPADFGDLDYVVITHRHPDHLHLPALEPIVQRTGATVITNTEVARQISEAGFSVEILDEGEKQCGAMTVEAIPTRHEPILSSELPQHTSYLINGRVLHAVDSLDRTMLRWAGVELLILPVMAPFLTEVEAMRFAKEMRPGAVLPVHDGYARAWFLEQRHKAYQPFMEQAGIQFHRIDELGGVVEL